ncbi:MAG: chemotaxis protein CheC [candidate division NC10 bacterium]|nr:chemotaxis protein CheC [candidate division NC10 bacterium]
MSQVFASLGERELETLRRVSHVGFDHAATALSQLLGLKVHLEAPEVRVLPLKEVTSLIGGEERLVAALYLRILGDARGNILVLFSREAMASLLGLLMGKMAGRAAALSEEDGSALKEVGNILASAYLSALSDLLRLTLIPSIPHLAFDLAGAVIDLVLKDLSGISSSALVIETRFQDPSRHIEGHILLMPHPHSLAGLFKAIKKRG